MCLLLYHEWSSLQRDYGFDGRPSETYKQHRNWRSNPASAEADLLLYTLHCMASQPRAVIWKRFAFLWLWVKSDFHGVEDKNKCYHFSWIWHSGHGLEVNMVVVPGWWWDLVISEVLPNLNHSTILGLYMCKCKQALWKIKCFSEVKRLFEVLISYLWNRHLPFHKLELLYS